jgi:hypothetical protein
MNNGNLILQSVPAAVAANDRVVLTDDDSGEECEDVKAKKQQFPDSVRDLSVDVTTTPQRE